MMSRTSFVVLLALALLIGPMLIEAGSQTPYQIKRAQLRQDLDYARQIGELETPLRGEPRPAELQRFELRSRHFVFGMPRLFDDRHFGPDGPGVSVVVREAFVAAYFEDMRTALWVCQRWTRSELERMRAAESLDRHWYDDPDLPPDFYAGTSYRGSETELDRGHMARHSMNRAWGVNSSIYGCLMTNCAPQHRSVNRGSAYRILEDAIADFDGLPEQVEALWTITGTAFTRGGDPTDFERAARITTGFGVPQATYKIVAWFGVDGAFNARGYLFEQPHRVDADGNLTFAIPDQRRPLSSFNVPLRAIELRTGVEFFPRLHPGEAGPLKTSVHEALWD